MIPTRDYQIFSKIYESPNSLIYRAVFDQSDQSIILKVLKGKYPDYSELTRYKQEYEITHSLKSDRIIKAYELQRYENSIAILLEDFGGKSLKKILDIQENLQLKEILSIAIKIAEGLITIHDHNIIHKDINPSNIIYNLKNKELKIIDFGISSLLFQENQMIFDSNKLEGTLAYIAPEQTGRMNRGVDYRSDFYAFGVTLYELLTNHLPFETSDPSELVHCHIAQQPLSIVQQDASLPFALSNIVKKMMEKMPEDRYQSARGIKADLDICLQELRNHGHVSQFPLGVQDISEKFHVPQKLYGREKDVTQLLNAFEQISQGSNSLVLVSGYSGIGKSALVNEIHKPIARQGGQFIRGKFDQFRRDIPYSAIAQAFQSLARKLLSEPEKKLSAWKTEILEVLDNNGQLIIDIIPEFEKIIGKQPSVEPLGATENQNRFNWFFKRFLSVFCQREHPLVLFIDDLQWADLSSLSLLEQLISDAETKYFLLIGAYRDNEVNSTHPLINTLEKIKKKKVETHHIFPSPLGINHINQLISDTLSCSIENSLPLAQLIARKTGGNPFFVTQLLYSLYQEKLLVFDSTPSFLDHNKSYWKWDIDRIKSVPITDNVIDLMIDKIERLDSNSQKNIKLAACIGNYFNLETLCVVNKKTKVVTARELQPALEEELILPLNTHYKIPLYSNIEELPHDSAVRLDKESIDIPYKFLHDRVQQAAYSLIPEREKKEIHLQIGRLILGNIKENELESKLFDIVNHLNEGSSLITDKQERRELIRLNLQAAKKSKSSAAYEVSLKYGEEALELLELNEETYQSSLTLDVNLEVLEILYLNCHYSNVKQLSATLLNQGYDSLEQVKIYQINALSYFADLNQKEAIESACKALSLPKININVPKGSDEIKKRTAQEYQHLKALLKGKKIKDLIHLPDLTDPYKISALAILQQMIPALNTTNSALVSWVVLTQINICIQYGNSPQSSGSYGFYPLFQSFSARDIDLAYQFGQLSLKLQEKHNMPVLNAPVTLMYYGFAWHWKEYIRSINAQEKCIDGFQKGRNVGDYQFASSCFISYYLINLFGGYNLEKISEKGEKYLKEIRSFKVDYSTNYTLICHRIVNILTGDRKQILVIGESLEEEESFLDNWSQNNNAWLLFIAYFAKAFCLYLFKNYDRAIDYAMKAEENIEACAKYLVAPQHNFYSSLAFLAGYNSLDESKKKEILDKVQKNQASMKEWTRYCPANFQHKYDLIEAEKAKVLGNIWQAEELYEKAIAGAKNYEFLHDEALAYERASEFYQELKRQDIGQLYLRNAHHCYTRWGAKAKVKELEESYPHYLLEVASQNKYRKLSANISTTANDGDILDLNTILKASQAISGEIRLEKLLQSLMKIVIENAGAEKGFLILNYNEQWVIECQGTISSENPTILQSIPINSIDPETSVPTVPTSIVNYIIRTQENIVLDEATSKGEFINDPYIVAHKSKSILCTPLLNQGQLKGIVYLENNLTTGAFTDDRVELLNILAAQAAISIDNSRLYQTLEQRVEERTQELSQTLDVLKATQAELIFENDLLRNEEQPSTFDYQVGGSLPMDSPTYVVRSADRTLYKTLRQGEFCYILNARQMGKSSLMVRMINHLQSEGVSCAAIDMTRIGSENVTPEQWYKGLAVELWRSFGLLRAVKLKTWWNERMDISPVQRLGQFIEEVILVEVGKDSEDNPSSQKLVLFIDEIDSVLGLDFPVSDFFRLIRSCYNQRTLMPEYQRLTFALFGVATPSELIGDRRLTPFNIGQSIPLQGFKEHEAQPLLNGLKDKVTNPQVLLREVLSWTGGQPFLTQKICKLIHQSSMDIPINQEAQWIEDLVRNHVLDEWESKDEPEHLKTIRDRIVNTEQSLGVRSLYHHILTQDMVASTDSSEERELILSGLVIKREGTLSVHNRIYQVIFNINWIESLL